MTILGTLQLGSQQARRLGVKPRVQQSPYLELCCLSQCAKGSYQKAEQAVERLTGVRVSAKTQQRIVQRNPMSAPQPPASVSQLALDGGMVRLVTPKGQASEWRQYKALRVNGDGPGMAWFQQDEHLLEWVQTFALATVVFCLGDGHAGIWSLYEQMPLEREHLEILDWFHLKQNLFRVGGSLKRLYQAEALLWQGKVDQTINLFQALRSESARRFCTYLQTHRSRIPNYDYYQSEGIPIGSGPAESWIKQIDQRLQLTGAQWLPRNVPQMLALRCRYLSDQLDLYSLSRR